ncbi:twitching motility protein PilT [Cylindrospermopsis raciborskii S07]|uniref:Type II toxin-antitoxin system VapC family toxin n=2 Tax=Cylindrospermopsis raciborskii TaxID=77022 RepID=A0A838WGX7_9CYAN|nr:type II toxin-antitoxin system VapC family toxin [Cylindrospermopsis raciborskii]MBA4444757.1 type II toxin-antitoxin system VapC family toxin [Cylindrospermopsis raciborskii CS-506_C]MBA4448971.1 type II toxin-antitoxin system VapC family toxin [Cylindrospermopsis raciborskii CS-506_D]MBA4455603.1 type II toxin-antitoxin system VapC family toxin [Cylindrospermopsis raciborskii CS-506_B]MBA4464951.1 type II toxin-antitoxin system VapC family toxin [Cylindrospermopsis raciborskii CS-506_A]PN
MYLLDTNICIALLNENRQAVAKFNRYFSQCYLSIIVVSELYKGVYCSQQVAKNLETLTEFIELLPVEPFEIEAAIEFGKIQSELRKIGKPTGEFDALIAAVARSRNDILVTNNIKDFINIPNLKLDNWLEN